MGRNARPGEKMFGGVHRAAHCDEEEECYIPLVGIRL